LVRCAVTIHGKSSALHYERVLLEIAVEPL